jgi:hypothetical protein
MDDASEEERQLQICTLFVYWTFEIEVEPKNENF